MKIVWHACVVVCRWRKGKLQTLVQQEKSLKPKFAHLGPSVRFPGGCRDSEVDPLSTGIRELAEEAYLGLRISTHINYLCHLPPRSDKDIPRFFYMVMEDDTVGTLRDIEIIDGDTDLGIPYWAPVDGLEKVLHERQQHALYMVKRHFGLI